MTIQGKNVLAVLLFLTIGCFQPIFAQGGHFENQVILKNLPVPKEKNQLFYLQRDPDANTVIYQLNLKNNRLDKKKPVHAYWKQFEQGGSTKALNYIQRTMAYGIQSKAIGENVYDLEIAAYKQLDLKLTYSEKHKKYLVITKINGKMAVLDRLFVRIVGGTVFTPDIRFYKLTGRDYNTNELLEEEIKP